MRDYLYSGVAVAALIVFTSPVSAQQSAPNIELETIQVEGQSGKTDKPTVATEAETVLTTRVTRQELDDRQITDFRDIERLSPGVSFNQGSRSFNIRGLDRARVLTTIDGIRLPWLEDGARGLTGGLNSFELGTLSSVDIIKGSDSTIFGGGGIGGTIAFRTLEPEDLIDPGNTWGGLTKGGYDSRDNSWRAEQAVAARVDDTFVMVQGGYRAGEETENMGDVGGYGTARTEKNPADYDQYNVLAKLVHYTDPNNRFGLTAEIFNREDDILTLNQTNTGNSGYVNGSVTNDEAIKRQRVSAHYDNDGGGWADAAQAVLYWQKQVLGTDFRGERLPTNTLPGLLTRQQERETEIFGINGSVLKILELGSTQHSVSFGGELFGSRDHQYSAGDDQCDEILPRPGSCNSLHTNQSDMPDVDGVTFGAFIQDEIAFADGRVRLTPGLRFDAYDYQPKLTDAFERNPAYASNGLPDASSDAGVSGKLRLEGDATENLTLYAQWSQGFRAPTPAELFLTYGAPGSYLVIGDPDLKTETSNGFEVGARVGDDQAGGGVSVFYNRYKNFIDADFVTPVPPGYMFVQQYLNRSNVEIYGAEVFGQYKHDSGWHGWGQFGAYVGEDMDSGVGLNTIPAAKLVLGLGYAQETWGTDLVFTAAAARDVDDVENVNSVTPSYQLLDFTAWWSPAQVEGLTLRAGIYNITDEKYFDTLDIANSVQRDYYSEPGRNVRVSATYKF